MREIGGYIELDRYNLKMLHGDGLLLNCGRKALEYLIKARNIKKILMPKYMCDSCDKVLVDNEVSVRYYHIDGHFRPVITDRDDDEYLYVVNFYGQLPDEYLCQLGERLIVDNAQAYFQEPVKGIDTLYTCRKFFGVPDGAILYTNALFDEELELDCSYDRMHFLLGRFEGRASDFYQEYIDNNSIFSGEKLKKMSVLTCNLLHALDYEEIKNRRTANFSYLYDRLSGINELELSVPEGAFMYPLYIRKGFEIRKELQKKNIFIPTLWPAVFKRCDEAEREYDMAMNILPIPVDQRYDRYDMEYICEQIFYEIKK